MYNIFRFCDRLGFYGSSEMLPAPEPKYKHVLISSVPSLSIHLLLDCPLPTPKNPIAPHAIHPLLEFLLPTPNAPIARPL